MDEYRCKNNIIPPSLMALDMPLEDYKKAHKSLVTVCHDVLIEYDGGILLVNRDIEPAKNLLWAIGGRVRRGMSIENSLKAKVLEECNLEISEIQEVGYARTYFAEDPFCHGRGVDTINFKFLAKGSGDLKLNSLHSQPTIARFYTKEYKDIEKTLHPYILNFINDVISIISRRDIYVLEALYGKSLMKQD